MAKRLQSAMEYLTTYGWAILIIAVAIVALFQLGVFNSVSLAPKASPGSCQVYRPSGLESTQQPQLAGSCNNEIPEYVAQFNGQTSYIKLAHSSALSPTSTFTLTSWILLNTLQASCCGSRIYMAGGGEGDTGFDISIPGSTLGQTNPYESTPGFPYGYKSIESKSFPTQNWEFIAVTFSSASGVYSVYTDGGGGVVSYDFTPGNTMGVYSGAECIGAYGCESSSDNLNGSIANVQIYNTSLSANDITALYQEGIGGAPIALYNLVGWYPLNGNSNDYSGNNRNGVANNVIYSENWWNTYSQP